jgi:hypothetical protein
MLNRWRRRRPPPVRVSTVAPPWGRTLIDRLRSNEWEGLHRLPLTVVVEVPGEERVHVRTDVDELILEPGRNVVDFGRWTLPTRGLLVQALDEVIRAGLVRELDE